MRTIQQPTLLNGSLVLTDQEDIANVTDTASLSASCDSNKMLLGEGDKLGPLGPDIISHTNPLSTMGKHRRKIIAIRDVDSGSGSGVSGSSAQGYRELSYSESYHEAFLAKPIGTELRNVQRDAKWVYSEILKSTLEP